MSKRNSMPSLSLNNFFVSKRASMFEICEESPKEKRERSPCGALEVSERKLRARKLEKRKAAMAARRKRQADPYAEQSTEIEDEDNLDIASSEDGKFEKIKNEIKACGHSNRSVNVNFVRKYLKRSVAVGECVHCSKAKAFSELPEEDTSYVPVVWLCAFCGYQGCDRNSPGKHAFNHYRTPRSDPHSIIINTQLWTVWCYDCDSEILPTSSKKLHEVIQHVKRLSEMAPKRTLSSQVNTLRPTTNLLTQYSGSDSRLYSRKSCEDFSKLTKNKKNYQTSMLISLPKVKGINNLGNTCFFNSVIQNLFETHFLSQMLDIHLQSGQRISLIGTPQKENGTDEKIAKSTSNCDENEEEDLVLQPLELFLSEGGPLSFAFCMLMKDMHSVGKNGVVNPSHLFGQICKKSTQFQGYQQQDAHELLRCLLDAIRSEEISRIKRSILKSFGLNEKTDPNTVTSHLRTLIKAYGKEAFHTIIDQIFGGQLISTVFCEECHWSSQVFEPFMDLSLPVNEEKGKPKKGGLHEDDSSFNCFGRSQNGSAVNVSNHQQKKQRKEERRRNRRNKGQRNQESSGGGVTLYPACIRVTNDDEDDEARSDKERVERRARRLTEKRRPEDEEEFREKEKLERRVHDQWMVGGTGKAVNRNEESSKAKRLMRERRAEERLEARSNDEESEEEEEGAGDGQECGIEWEEETILGPSRPKQVSWTDTRGWGEHKDNNDIDAKIRNLNSKNASKTFRETSDADVEDNADSEYIIHSCFNNTRHPSIVVDESNTDPIADSETIEVDSRFLKTSNSCEHLNYSSDCSERYFTAAGPDTMDELDNIPPDSYSLRSDKTTTNSTTTTTTTSGKGDSISISSGELAGFQLDDNRRNSNTISDPYLMDDMCLKVSEVKIRRKSSSRESLLDSTKSFQMGSLETLHTFNSSEQLNDESSHWSKDLAMKKLKQEWIARSLTTLAPRYQCGRQECSVMSCLTNFTAPELITGNNKINCENCTKIRANSGQENDKPVKSNASKQLLILSPPAVLTLHLKRFHHVGYNLTKVNRYVQFPLVLDMAPFTSSISLGLGNMSKNQTQVLYGLYGIVEHSGRLNSGHYVAYVRSRPLDSTRTSKQLLNLKPWSQFEINRLVSDMAGQREKIINANGIDDDPPWKPLDAKFLEEEIKAGRWFHVSDTYVAEVTVEKVLKSQAYLLFYERIL